MTRNRRLFFFTGVLLVLCIAALSAHAAEEGGSPAEQPLGQMFKWINFAIVAGILGWVFLKKLPSMFCKNAEKISSAITKATAAKAGADRQLSEAETKLARLEQEVAELRANIQREAAAETQRLRNLTQSDAQKIAVAAKAEIEAAERAALLELKAIAAKLAVDGAESLLAKQLTPQAQEALISSFVKSVDRFASTREGRPN
jgi:F-type H+-transporting ATPase subunit b